jgi:excinuclease ABC subunit A
MSERKEYIIIKGAREHNLKNISLKIPKYSLTVITGISGSGKSSLAFDTIYAEGQRRYVESMSSYARQFLEQLQKPDYDYIEGLSPAIAIEQRTASFNPRSTVATQSEIYDFLRLLFARIGVPHCFKCGKKISGQTSQEILDKVMALPLDTRIIVFAPVIRYRKGEFNTIFEEIRKEGFVRVRIDEKLFDLSDKIHLDKNKKHAIEVVIDRLVLQPNIKKRLSDSIETALKVGKGLIIIHIIDTNTELCFNEQYICPDCSTSFEEISPRMFSFNSPYGACKSCLGLGTKTEIDPDLVIPDRTKTIREGAIEPWRKTGKSLVIYYGRLLYLLSEQYNFNLDTPFYRLDKKTRGIILYGSSDIWILNKPFEGVLPNLKRRFEQTESGYVKTEIHKYMSMLACPSCNGARLGPESLSVKISGKNIIEVTKLSVEEALNFFVNLSLTDTESKIAQRVLKEIKLRLDFMINIGIGYLTLDRQGSTLSGGETQRIRLATQIGSGLTGVLYILDEPSIGLHQRDNAKLLSTLKSLRDLGNTLIIVEHDEITIRSADYIIDLGPGAGKHGGSIVACGNLSNVLKSEDSLTAKYLNGKLGINIPIRKSLQNKNCIMVRGACEHNLKNIDVKIPLGLFVCITGVSGSGKSTLVYDILYRALAQKLYKSRTKPGKFKDIEGHQFIDKVIIIDQSPIGRTPRSNPATYTGTFSHIRDLFSKTKEARIRGYKPGRFSFNVKGGRCEACQGDGVKRIEMHFLPDVYVTCEVCKGKRFNEQTLDVRYKSKSIADILEMTAEDAFFLFEDIPRISHKLKTICDVGLGYIELGQSSTTLSGGEAQRIKLAFELSHRATGKTLYILDEPTSGLHFADIENLLKILHILTYGGNTVVIIEHNLDVIKSADYIIDLGPEGGPQGGFIVAEGYPEEIIKNSQSYTGQYLKKVLNKRLKNDKI